MDITGCSLAELVDDPLIDLVMKRDRVDRNEFRLLLQRVACERLRAKELTNRLRPPPPVTEAVACSRC
jgi:hypothetical protein